MSLNIPHLENEIIDQYLYDEHPSRPWIIGFSGGKDSTMLLQVVWNALKKIEPALLTRQIYVVCNDTLVENPRIVKFIKPFIFHHFNLFNSFAFNRLFIWVMAIWLSCNKRSFCIKP